MTETKNEVNAAAWLVNVAYNEECASYYAELTNANGLPYRNVYGCGPTKEEALGELVKYHCDLTLRGHFNPNRPDARGVCPVQHLLDSASGLLNSQIESRFEDWEFGVQSYAEENKPSDADTTAGGMWTKSPLFNRRNEVIAGISTAIAALARIKEL